MRVSEEGRARVSIAGPSRPGAYRLRLRDADRTVAEAAFVVEASGDELADPLPDPDRLARLASEGHGRFFESPDRAPALSDLDATRERSLGLVPFAPFASPIALVVLVVLFGAEFSRVYLRLRHSRPAPEPHAQVVAPPQRAKVSQSAS